MEYAYHRIANIFPLMQGEEFERLAADIQTNGLLEPVVIYEGAILDGRNRYRACVQAGVEPRFIDYGGDNPLAYVISKNRHRRHLTSGQLAVIAAQQEELMAELATEARERMLAGVTPDPIQIVVQGTTDQRAADLFGTNRQYVQDAKRLKETAPDLLEKVAAGEVSLPEAKREYKERERQERRAERETRNATLAEQHAGQESFTLYTGDFVTVCTDQIGAASIDVIITDPPYPREFLPVYEQLAVAAARVLKPGGSLIVMVGQSYLPDIIKAMAAHIRYHWTLAYLTPGGQSPQIFPRKVNTFWKPLLWFVNGDYAGDWHGDVIKSDPNDNDKRFHHWGQSESGMARIVESFSLPGQTVLDPFCGGGTTGAIAVATGRDFIGVDVDPTAIQTANERIAAAMRRVSDDTQSNLCAA